MAGKISEMTAGTVAAMNATATWFEASLNALTTPITRYLTAGQLAQWFRAVGFATAIAAAASPTAINWVFQNGSGADNAAGNLTITAPLSTGNATPASLIFQVGQQVAGSSSTVQTATTALAITSTTAAAVPLLQVATGKMQFGAAAGITGAVNVDGATYAGVAFNAVHGTGNAQIFVALNGTTSIGSTAAAVSFFAANQGKWTVGASAGISALTSTQVVTRIISGSTSFALQSSGGSDRWAYTEGGTLMTLTQATANFGVLTSTGYSLTGSSAVGMVSYTGTTNTSGNPTIFSIAITNTAVGSTTTSLIMQLLGGASGTTNLMSVSFSGILTTAASIVSGANITLAAASSLIFNGRSILTSSADGIVTMSDNAGSAFTRLTFGGVGSGVPAISKNAGNLDFVNGDNSAFVAGRFLGIFAGTASVSTTFGGFAAGTTAKSSLNLAHGVAPSSPVNGDMWTTTAGLFVRINGATVGPLS